MIAKGRIVLNLHPLVRFAAAASVLALASAASAQAAEENAEEVIVTAQRANQTQVVRAGQVGVLGDKAAADVPFTIKSYNSALILNQQPQTLGQVLENDPSIRTTYGFGNAAEQFVLRGFVLYGDDIGMDGLYGITPRQLVAPELYESVQVLNGASAFLNGAAPGGSGIGGSVNLVPKRAGDTDLTRGTVSYTSDAHVGGSFDVARRFSGGAFGVRVNGAYKAGDVSIDDEFRRTAVIGAALDYRGADVRLSLDLAYQRVKVRQLRPKVTIASASVPRVPDADHNYGQPFTYTTLRDLFGTLHGEWDITDNAMLYGSFGARDGSEEGIYGGITVNDALTGAATGNASYIPRTDNNEAAVVGMRVKLAAGGISHEFNFGANRIWQVNRNAYDFRYGPDFLGFATNLYNTVDVPLQSSSLVGGDLDDPFAIGRVRLGSVFASDTIGVWEDRILLTAGLRLQTLNVKSYSYADGSLATGYSESAITPVVGLVVKPVEGLSLFANRMENLAQGPTAPLTGLDAAAGLIKPVVNAGQVFNPYRATQYEVGGKVTLGPINASVALFTTKLPIGQVAPEPGNPAFVRYGLFGNQRNRGIELSIDGEIARGLRVIAGGALTDAELRDTPGGVNEGNDAPGVPDYTANANVEWDLPFLRALTLTGRVVQTGKQKVDQANTLELSSWTRFDLGARYVAVIGQSPITFRFNVDNVANKRYWASSYDAFNQTLLQGAPRTFKLSATFDM
jgi:iron complex outermembrane receptor protein